MSGDGLRALVVDDEKPALDELVWLLERDRRIGRVAACSSATDVLRALQDDAFDVVFLDVEMPGLTGLEVASVLGRFAEPPQVVFVTAHEEHAVEAFAVRATDYVLKPVREERLAEAVRRVCAGLAQPERAAPADAAPASPDLQIAVERGGVTRFVERSSVTHVEAQGDYARLHTPSGSHLVRIPLTTLERDWADAGFVRIHRSLLVSLAHVTELRMDQGRCTVLVGDTAGGRVDELAVSRRHTRELRDVMLRRQTS